MNLKNKDILIVELELTGICNLNCPLCARNQKGMEKLKQKNIRSLEDIVKQLDEYPSIKICYLAGILSEPTLYPYIKELIQYLIDRNIQVELNSNANTHNEDWWFDLGTILTKQDRVLFTVCGSTQEIHSKYRVGSNLEQLLNHTKSFRKGSEGKKNDVIQHIRFNYNADDLETAEMKSILNQFSRVMTIDSLPYQERFDVDCDIKMTDERSDYYNRIKKIGESRVGQDVEMNCKSFELKFLAIDQWGKVAPCFLWKEQIDKNFDMDYTDIMAFKHKFCYECEKLTCSLLNDKGIERMA